MAQRSPARDAGPPRASPPGPDRGRPHLERCSHSRSPRHASNRHGSAARRRRSRTRQRRARNAGKRDKDKDAPHFRWRRGMSLGPNGRYVVQKLLGDGTFGRVLGCMDMQTKENVAVKVVKGVRRYCEHAEAEAEVLSEILRLDPGRQSLCVELRDHFLHPRQHYCIVFEPLDISVRDFLKATGNMGLYLSDIRQLARQLLQSLSFLHRIGVTHTDLKCRNVMLRDGSFDVAPHPRVAGKETRRPRNCRLAVIDFGGAVFPDERHGGRVGTRQFRAPEVVLGLPWDQTSDLWSAGCIIAMLYLGQRPFSVHEDTEHLAMMERLLGTQIPKWMAVASGEQMEHPQEESGPLGQDDALRRFFDVDGRLRWPLVAPDTDAVKRVAHLQPLEKQVMQHHQGFLHLILGLLEIDPRRRLLAAAALQKNFFVDDGIRE